MHWAFVDPTALHPHHHHSLHDVISAAWVFSLTSAESFFWLCVYLSASNPEVPAVLKAFFSFFFWTHLNRWTNQKRWQRLRDIKHMKYCTITGWGAKGGKTVRKQTFHSYIQPELHAAVFMFVSLIYSHVWSVVSCLLVRNEALEKNRPDESITDLLEGRSLDSVSSCSLFSFSTR